jgi:hypothetical protein
MAVREEISRTDQDRHWGGGRLPGGEGESPGGRCWRAMTPLRLGHVRCVVLELLHVRGNDSLGAPCICLGARM